MRYQIIPALLMLVATGASAQKPPTPPPPRPSAPPEAPVVIGIPDVESIIVDARTDSTRPTLGLYVQATGTKRDTLGLFVTSVAKDGPAEQAGVYEGQRVAAINGIDLRVAAADLDDDFAGSISMHRLMRTMEKIQPGSKVELRVYADGRMKTVEVKAARFIDVFKGQMPTIGMAPGRFFQAPPAGVMKFQAGQAPLMNRIEIVPGQAGFTAVRPSVTLAQPNVEITPSQISVAPPRAAPLATSPARGRVLRQEYYRYDRIQPMPVTPHQIMIF